MIPEFHQNHFCLLIIDKARVKGNTLQGCRCNEGLKPKTPRDLNSPKDRDVIETHFFFSGTHLYQSARMNNFIFGNDLENGKYGNWKGQKEGNIS